MLSAQDRTERNEALLGELADLGMTLARDLHARAMAASDDKLAAEMALAFHRVSRSVRQTLALDSRLERERRLMDREDRQDRDRETLRRVQKKRSDIRRAVSSLIWTEHEADEAEELMETLEALVWDESTDEQTFLETPVETCIERIRSDLGLPANDDETDAEDQATDLRQSSG